MLFHYLRQCYRNGDVTALHIAILLITNWHFDERTTPNDLSHGILLWNEKKIFGDFLVIATQGIVISSTEHTCAVVKAVKRPTTELNCSSRFFSLIV